MAQARVSSTDEVIAAAARVFLQKGFQGSTIDDIARAANISKPTVYQYAKNKQWLLDRIIELICRTLGEGQRTIMSADAPAAVRFQWIIRMYIEFAVTYRSSFRLSFSQQTDLSVEARDALRLWTRRTGTEFADLLAECRREGSLRWPGEIMNISNLILSMLNSTYRWFHPQDVQDSDSLATEVTMLLSGVFTFPDMGPWPMPELPELQSADAR